MWPCIRVWKLHRRFFVVCFMLLVWYACRAPPSSHVPTPLPSSNGSVFICITGQLERLELESKIDKLITPLVSQSYSVHVQLSLTQGNLRMSNSIEKQKNLDEDVTTLNASISPVTLDLATNELYTAGVQSVIYHEPVHDSNIPINKQLMKNLYNKYHKWRGEAYTQHRAENHLRQFQTLATCVQGLDRMIERPEHVVRVRDDGYIVNVEISLFKILQDASVPTIVTQSCASWGGINDKMAIVSGNAAKAYFTLPLNLYHRDVESFINNPETYYMDTYRRANIELQTSKGISVVTSRYINNGRYLETMLRGVHTCEKNIIQNVDDKCHSIQAFDAMVNRITRYPIENVSGIFNRQNPMCPNSIYNVFHVIIPFYNIGKKNLRAVLQSMSNQNYMKSRLRIWLIDDKSTNAETLSELGRICIDRSVKTAEDYTRLQHLNEYNVICLTNSAHLGAAGNKFFAFKFLEKVASPNDVLVVVDGDDELLPGALEVMNSKYVTNNVWCTYGSYKGMFSTQTKNLTKFNPRENFFPRKESDWKYGHPRSFKMHLIRHMKVRDFRRNGKWLQKATDRSYIYPMLELSGPSRIGYIDKQIYLYKFRHSTSTIATTSLKVRKKDLKHVKRLQPHPKYELPVHVVLTLWKRVQILRWQLESLQRNSIIGRRLHIHLLNNNVEMKNKVDLIVTTFVKESDGVILLENYTEDCSTEFCVSTFHNDANWHAFSRFIYIDKVLKVVPMDYVIFLDDDQLWKPDHISSLLNEYRPKSMTTWFGKNWDGHHQGKLANYWKTIDIMDRRQYIKSFKYGGPGGSIIDTNLWLFTTHLFRPLNSMQRYHEFDDIWVSFVLDAMLGWKIRRTIAAFPYLLDRHARRPQGRMWNNISYYINGSRITDFESPARKRLAKELANVGTFSKKTNEKEEMFYYLQKKFFWDVYAT